MCIFSGTFIKVLNVLSKAFLVMFEIRKKFIGHFLSLPFFFSFYLRLIEFKIFLL